MTKEERAIAYLKTFEPAEGYYVCESGGKDSAVIRTLCQIAGVKHELHHNLTTVDAPETVQYVKKIPGIIIRKPEKTMWQLIVDRGIPPTRLARYCCEELKESGGQGRLCVTGVRWAESPKRKESADFVKIIGKPESTKKLANQNGIEYRETRAGGIVLNDDNAPTRQFVDSCYRTRKTMINPIVDWEDDDVWDFLRYYGVEVNPLYSNGFCRVGCIGCPLGGSKSMKREFVLYPKYKENYIRAFDKMVQRRKERGLPTQWNSGEEVFKWWIGDDPNQIGIDFGEDMI